MANRGRRGGGRETIDNDDSLATDEDPNVIVLDEEGNEVSDDAPVLVEDHTDEPAEVIAQPQTEDAVAVIQQRFEALQAERAIERQQLAEANRRLEAAENESVSNAWLAVEQAEIASGADIATAKQLLAAAMASQDFEAAAEAQAKLTEAINNAGEVRRAKQQLEANFGTADKPKPRQRPAAEPAAQPAPATQQQGRQPQFDHTNAAQVEAVYKDLTPKTQEWTRKHHNKIFGDNQTVFKAMNLHGVAVQQLGLKPETPEYFEFLEKHLGIEPAKQPAPAPRQNNQQRRARPMAAAPANRGGAGPAPVSVTLTANERQIAARLGMTATQYAANKKKIDDGAKDPNYRGPVFTRDQRS